MPCTKLGRLVRDGKIRSMEQVFLFSLPIKEYQVTDLFMKVTLALTLTLTLVLALPSPFPLPSP